MKRSFGEIHGEYVRQRKADFILHRGQIIFSDDPNFQHCLQEEFTNAKQVQLSASFFATASVGSKNFQNLKENSGTLRIVDQALANKTKSCRVMQNKINASNEPGNGIRTLIEFLSKIFLRAYTSLQYNTVRA